jgi:hypothetical protein
VTTNVAEGTKLYKRPSAAIKYSHQFESAPSQVNRSARNPSTIYTPGASPGPGVKISGRCRVQDKAHVAAPDHLVGKVLADAHATGVLPSPHVTV